MIGYQLSAITLVVMARLDAIGIRMTDDAGGESPLREGDNRAPVTACPVRIALDPAMTAKR
jgi:hypothetical protein